MSTVPTGNGTATEVLQGIHSLDEALSRTYLAFRLIEVA
jgi:hypothetical protein